MAPHIPRILLFAFFSGFAVRVFVYKSVSPFFKFQLRSFYTGLYFMHLVGTGEKHASILKFRTQCLEHYDHSSSNSGAKETGEEVALWDLVSIYFSLLHCVHWHQHQPSSAGFHCTGCAARTLWHPTTEDARLITADLSWDYETNGSASPVIYLKQPTCHHGHNNTQHGKNQTWSISWLNEQISDSWCTSEACLFCVAKIKTGLYCSQTRNSEFSFGTIKNRKATNGSTVEYTYSRASLQKSSRSFERVLLRMKVYRV